MSCTQNIIASIGMFDGVHRGHVFVLSQLKQLADERNLHPRVYTFNSHPLASLCPEKAPARLSSAEQRRKLIRESGIEDVRELYFPSIRRQSGADFLNWLKEEGVVALIMGFNNHIGSDRLNASEAAALNILEIIPEPEPTISAGVSSTAVRNLLSEGNVARAAELLGRLYAIEGTVVYGQQIGNTLGYPTANICPTESEQQLPIDGVYVVAIDIPGVCGKAYGMANIGMRPTIKQSNLCRTIEVNIFNFSGNIYGQTVCVHFIEFLRKEKCFKNVAELVHAIGCDRKEALAVIKKYLEK